MKNIYLLLFIVMASVSITMGQTTLTTAKDFSVRDTEGDSLHLFEFLDDGKLVVIDFFATACGPCGDYAPDIQASYEYFGSNTGNVIYMGICWGDGDEGVQFYDSVYGVTYPSVSGFDGGGNLVHLLYEIPTYPTVILIDPDRTVLNQYIWEPTTENINAAVIAAGGVPVGINEAKNQPDALTIYPNPAIEYANIEINYQGETDCYIEVYDILGSLIEKIFVDKFLANKKINISLHSFNEGVYFVSLVQENKVKFTQKLIVTK